MKKIINNKWFYLIIIFLFMIIFNFLTPYIMDDYLLMFDHTETKRITSVFEIINELYKMYFNWGGRVLAHFFAYLFLMLPKWIFNIVNSIIYSLNIYLIYLIARGKNKDNYIFLLLIHMIMFLLFPVFGQVFLWLDGSCNYSFTLCIQLFFLYKILNIKDNKYNYIVYVLISLFAGMCNENSSLSLIIFLFIYMFYDKSNLKLKIISLISLVCGYLFLFLAPGNYVRMKVVGGRSLFDSIFEKFIFLIVRFWPILLAVTLLLIAFYIKNKEKRQYKISLIIYISSLITFFSMMASPQLSVRSFTMSVIYIFIIVSTIIFNINKKSIVNFIFVIFSLCFICFLIPTFKEYYDYSKFMSDRDILIRKEKKAGKKAIRVKKYKLSNNCTVPTSSCDFYDIREDRYEFPNKYMGKYYGIDIYGIK